MSNNKWIKLDGKKDPPANGPLMVWQPDKENANGGNWHKSQYLLRIEFDGYGKKQYIFKCGEHEVSDATHYAIISKPTE